MFSSEHIGINRSKLEHFGAFPKTRSANRNKSEENGEIGTNRGDPLLPTPKWGLRPDHDTFETHRDAPPICITLVLQKHALLLVGSIVPYRPLICSTICLPVVSRCFRRSIRVRGRWDISKDNLKYGWLVREQVCEPNANPRLVVITFFTRPQLGPFFVLKFVRSWGFGARFLQPFPKALVTVKHYLNTKMAVNGR